ncbi:uncharacterized protein RCC_04853 [Ramularia collo-cygni]|uniref:SnoaL-like domain-containing protein n=1 Tax=Ramularia collo-cygni TaxID=112498 RepID=A0A2D3UUV5_9PEZI|nr:uncharacterized protein RCC_04853 [Ramularia collo-cygni]CZT19008.1 uncharacterized protein RCC_04853 [Ramularia collo-cygni]
MPQRVFTVSFPLDAEFIKDHQVLQFYAAYGKAFPKNNEEWATVSFEDWYAKDCKTILVDGTTKSGGQESWDYFQNLYARFPKVERDVLSFIVVADDERHEYKLHANFNTKLFADGGSRVVEVPQSFVYTVGKSDAGKGTDGFQFRELRNYYDLRTLEGAFA